MYDNVNDVVEMFELSATTLLLGTVCFVPGKRGAGGGIPLCTGLARHGWAAKSGSNRWAASQFHDHFHDSHAGFHA